MRKTTMILLAVAVAAALALSGCATPREVQAPEIELPAVKLPKGYQGDINITIQTNTATDNSAIHNAQGDTGDNDGACSYSGANQVGEPADGDAPADGPCDDQAAVAVDGPNEVNTEIDEGMNALGEISRLRP